MPDRRISELLIDYRKTLEFQRAVLRADGKLEFAEYAQAASLHLAKIEKGEWPDETGLGAVLWNLPRCELEQALTILSYIRSICPVEYKDIARPALTQYRLYLDHGTTYYKPYESPLMYSLISCAKVGLELLQLQQWPRPYVLGPCIWYLRDEPVEIVDAVFELVARKIISMDSE